VVGLTAPPGTEVSAGRLRLGQLLNGRGDRGPLTYRSPHPDYPEPIGSGEKENICAGMSGSPHLEVQIEFEASGILTGRLGNRYRQSARRIDNDDAPPSPQEREQVVDERRVAEMNMHGAAVMEFPTPGALSECGRAIASLQDQDGGLFERVRAKRTPPEQAIARNFAFRIYLRGVFRGLLDLREPARTQGFRPPSVLKHVVRVSSGAGKRRRSL
jgi:hypothetical protein